MKLKEKIIGSFTILVLSIVFLIFGYFSGRDKSIEYDEVFIEEYSGINQKENEASKGSITEPINNINIDINNSQDIVVDIKGAVKNPREYRLNSGARVRDLIEAAGGLTLEADENRIKFSQILKDEDCIKIYKIGEEMEEDTEIYSNTSSPGEGKNSSGKININKASSTELQSLPGIGQVKAQSIIDYRESVGGFKSVDELTNITGIGAKTVDKLRDMVDIK